MNNKTPDQLRIEFVKSSLFRVVHPDGAFGGTTPRLELFIDFYTERFPIPKVLVYGTSPDGAPADEIIAERESKEGIIRESEVGIVLDLPVAKSFAEWLNAKVAELEKAHAEVAETKRQRDLK
jgi:hypothetical protein